MSDEQIVPKWFNNEREYECQLLIGADGTLAIFEDDEDNGKQFRLKLIPNVLTVELDSGKQVTVNILVDVYEKYQKLQKRLNGLSKAAETITNDLSDLNSKLGG